MGKGARLSENESSSVKAHLVKMIHRYNYVKWPMQGFSFKEITAKRVLEDLGIQTSDKKERSGCRC